MFSLSLTLSRIGPQRRCRLTWTNSLSPVSRYGNVVVVRVKLIGQLGARMNGLTFPVVKLLSKTWWIPTGARLEGPKLEPKGPRAQVVVLTADQGFLSIQGTLLGFYNI